jgi:hypothetical protein
LSDALVSKLDLQSPPLRGLLLADAGAAPELSGRVLERLALADGPVRSDQVGDALRAGAGDAPNLSLGVMDALGLGASSTASTFGGALES